MAPKSSTFVYGPLTPMGRRRALRSRQLPTDLERLRERLVSRQRLSRFHVHDIALSMRVQIDTDASTHELEQNLDRLLVELARQAGCSRDVDLLSGDWGKPGRRELEILLPASDWQIAVSAIQLAATDDFTAEEIPGDKTFSTSRDTFDVLSGGREPEEFETPWGCAWGECGFSGPVGEMVYYSGSGMTGLLCRPCAAEQIRSDRL